MLNISNNKISIKKNYVLLVAFKALIHTFETFCRFISMFLVYVLNAIKFSMRGNILTTI